MQSEPRHEGPVLVALLQAYVFAILTCIYLNDTLHAGHRPVVGLGPGDRIFVPSGCGRWTRQIPRQNHYSAVCGDLPDR